MADDEGTEGQAAQLPPENGSEGRAAQLPEGKDDDGTDWKAEARKWERQAKTHASKLAEIEDSQKSEQQKLAERAEAAERRAAEAEIRVLRADVAAAKGIPAQLAQRLVGTTREELEADADTLLTTLTPTKPKVPPADAVAGQNNGGGGSRDPRDIFASLVKGG